MNEGIRTIRLMAVALFVALVAPLHVDVARANSEGAAPTADQAMRSVWSALDEAWNARDASRFSQLFAADASLGFAGQGPPLQGRASIHQEFARQFSRHPPELRHRTTLGASRPIAPAVLGVDGEVEIVRAGDPGRPAPVVARFAIFAVMRESAEGWTIHSLRVSLLSMEPANKGNSG